MERYLRSEYAGQCSAPPNYCGPSATKGGNTLSIDPVLLAQELIKFPSLNPPGEEKACADFVASLLSSFGFAVQAHEFAPGRPSLVATLPGSSEDKPLCFTGHLDVVPLGSARWSHDPFAAEIVEGKLYGRGSSDMKAGVAAFIAAVGPVLEEDPNLRRGLKLVITAGEETGCEGAFHLARLNALGDAALLIVAEPTSNQPIFAHKGSLRIRVSARGRTAHSSMPNDGDNAIERICQWIGLLRDHDLGPPHALLGPATMAVTLIEGGQNINSIPDFAQFAADFRTLPGQSHERIVHDLQHLFGNKAEIAVLTDFSGFSTDPDESMAKPLLQILKSRTGRDPSIGGAPYFTDASALVPGFRNVPTVVIGPGEAAQCHKTDEFCFVQNIRDACGIYADLVRKLCRS
ncbi:MAG: M20 family metallopeptidase [Bradyrhizobium sp.]